MHSRIDLGPGLSSVEYGPRLPSVELGPRLPSEKPDLVAAAMVAAAMIATAPKELLYQQRYYHTCEALLRTCHMFCLPQIQFWC